MENVSFATFVPGEAAECVWKADVVKLLKVERR